MRTLLFLLLLCLSFSLGCQNGKKDYLITIHTIHGDMKLILYDSTPIHKANFLRLAKSKAYDSSVFHRVIKGFMIQSEGVKLNGDSVSSADSTLPAEFHKPFFHRKGALSAARTNNPEKRSSASQFYIVQGETVEDPRSLTVDSDALSRSLFRFLFNSANKGKLDTIGILEKSADKEKYLDYLYKLVPEIEQQLNITLTKEVPKERIQAYTTVGGTPHLDDEYTVFGQVVEGLEVIDKIAAVSTDQSDKPETPVSMSMEVEEVAVEDLRSRYNLDDKMRLQ